jgi:hypothetical protein
MCFRFLPNAEVTAELRGAPVFRQHQRILRRSPLLNGHKIYLETSTEKVRISPCELWFILMPGHIRMAEILEERPFNAVIVDYHADVLNLLPFEDHSPESNQAGRTIPREAWEWWSQPEQQQAMRRALTAADVITTPLPELIPALKQFTHRTVHLPDTKRGKLDRFRAAWENNVMAAAREATEEKRT